ncbi:glycoside hydrolase 105 family protein [Paenibacillus sambharensis]|uniref:Glycoside hydrolase 105 family protein n=1 Tax=Paenibacillus sambharensis TaxID=1803190 RepID=A0A2W1KZM4_9BACL|nr:glycoside hydrolase family 88 protein [Paenibacillus sambharensis]PZD93118.1 glycoside hydrolase 105 family protein [Paenibacillus sambharensis]
MTEASHAQQPLQWAKDACRSIMETYTPAQLPPEGRWHYHQGVFLYGMLRLWEETGEAELFDYIKGYVDHLVDEHGNFLFDREELDAIQAGVLLFTLHKKTGDDRYKKAADKLRHLFDTLNKTSEGGYWHKDKYPYQMWLDGLYMGGAFAVRYGWHYGEPDLYDMVLEQERLMRSHTRDEATGLYYHAWDESRRTPWSDPETGRAPEVWGRAMGWYGFALADFLTIIPEGYEGRDALIEVERDLLTSLLKHQDQKTGMWYQVIDKGDRPDNWLETSCSALYIFALAKAEGLGIGGDQFAEAAERGFKGLLEAMRRDDNGRFIMPEICIGTGVGDYEHYIKRPRCENDLHGVGAFVLACVEMDALRKRRTAGRETASV